MSSRTLPWYQGHPHGIEDPPCYQGPPALSRLRDETPAHPSSGGCGDTSLSPADLDKLLSDLRSFLLLLDRESLSTAARAKKRSVSELLARLQGPPCECGSGGGGQPPGGSGGCSGSGAVTWSSPPVQQRMQST